jgi:hypothetical protein
MINSSMKRVGDYREMSGFELDRLFGLALTDARFFRQLREQPYQAVSRFDLTETEAQAVLRIAPTARSIQELALELDAWMTDHTTETVKSIPQGRMPAMQPALRRPAMPLPRGGRQSARYEGEPSYVEIVPMEPRDDGQRICLPLSECLSQN